MKSFGGRCAALVSISWAAMAAEGLRIYPEKVSLAGLGAIFEELERPEQALEVYRAALAIHPQQPGVLEAVERLQALTQGQDL